ncbi:MAG: bifunctional phosphopantothenoylcysteine decarboxylase/phosphopantothenate--cysteine ligase CoaBC [Deltaproteobacteria bacterium]|nr:bifunctional phosphopantothenoylcysteine decarboxylase/phosphopantothenate--cysteine ligase CoaBC [Deltaproteobacteria bacterium]
MTSLSGKTVALAVAGSIAAYKAVEVARLCIKAGAKVVPLLTASGARFVGAVTLSGITGESVATDMWDPAYPGEMHVAIAARADVLAIVPATADILARLAHGRADDLVTATALCMRGPVLVAPAMHPNMWTHPATQANVATLAEQGRVTLVGPVEGPVASGDVGMGRMSDPSAIVDAIARAVASPRDLAGRHVVVTAGPTYEPLDPVRFLGNRSSGRMGFAIAAAAAARGARVTLIAGPVSVATPRGVVRVDVESATAMQAALDDALGADLTRADALVMAAAVADYRPAEASATKLKKEGDAVPSVTLVKNPDLLATIGAKRAGARPILVGFALETGDDGAVLAYARKKLDAKKVDLVVANAAHESLGRATNRVAFVSRDGASAFVESPKEALADQLLDRLVAALS